MTPTRNERLLLAGDGLSAFGSWIDFLAILTLAAYQFHVTSYEMAVVSAAGLLPGMLLSPWIGRLCDKKSPRNLLLVSLAGRALATAALLVCHDYWVFLALVGLRSVFAAVAPPAINVMAMGGVAAERRARFYAMLNVLNNSAKVLAPAIGTVSSSMASESFALTMSLLCSAVAWLVFSAIRLAPKPMAAEKAIPTPSTALSTKPPLVPLLWVASTCAFFIFMVNNLFPLVLQQSGFDKALLGVLVSCSGAGNILSGLWLAKRSAATAPRAEIGELLLPACLQALGFGAMGYVLWLKPAHASLILPMLFFVVGTFSARYAIALNVHVSTHYASTVGHVWGVLQAWQNAMILVAPLIGAVVLDRLGPGWLFAFSTGSAGLSFALLWVARAVGVPRLQVTAPLG